jgi:TRAP-type C4-dicarboxylate transport system substrate-binding protein
MFRKLFLMLAAAGMVMATAAESEAGTLTVGTLAPKGSPWMNKFQEFSDKVKSETGGDIELVFKTYSDEPTMVRDIEQDAIAGGAMTAVGLSKIYMDVLIFQLPGLFASWAKLDNARNSMKGQIDKVFEGKGYSVLGWGDVGAAKIMTTGFEARVPNDLKGKGCFVIQGDPIGQAFWAKLGNTPSTVTVPEIFLNIQKTIHVVVAPPLVAEQFQWASKLDTITTVTAGFGIGALVFKTKWIQGPKEQTLRDRGREAAQALTGSIRNADGQSFGRLKSRKKVVDPTEDERKQWATHFADTRAQLRGTLFTAAVYDQIVNLAK